ncbi:alpha/beta fold hydrolase [Kutzneria viridogrisea]|uniref:Pimeloyl-ACP methyl ester carboxylesterase n=1 Tax=Kutzneria viridogrisea TaxID=47990 RepID=A0ABR6BI33_9PSEU|nr:pimeloyl-ACP methyl ester carboxylesterase [Kutzneria viridogrisea]
MRHRYVDVDGVRVFYREVGPADAPTVLLLHGFPTSSHQYRELMTALGTRLRLIAPDLPGFGHTEPLPGTTTFDRLAEVVGGFVERIGLDRFLLYVFDYGAPVGFRLAQRHPGRIAGLVVQNGNAYEEGLSEQALAFIRLRREVPGDADRARAMLSLDSIRAQYLTGVADPELISPDGWSLDQYFLELPGRAEVQLDLMFDYHTNVESYPRWQAWLREHRPPTLITWGRNDPFFTEPGARAYLRDLPDARLHLFDTGHFALEEELPAIAHLLGEFSELVWSSLGASS